MERFIAMKTYSPRLPRSVVSITLMIAGLFCALPSHAATRTIDKTLVVVNDDVILESDVDKFAKKIKSKSFQELFGGVNEQMLKNPEAVLQLLVEEKLINQQVKKLELQASDQEVDGQIAAITKRNGISKDQLMSRLKQLGTSIEEYRDGIRRQIERKNLIEREIKPSLEVTDEQLRHFYLRNAKPEEADTQYKIAHILVSKAKGSVSLNDRAKKVSEEIALHPADFDKLAQEYSDDETTAPTGGVLGWLSLSQLAKEFRRAVPGTPPGTVTAPLKAADGYHIIKVLETRRGDFSTLTKEQKDTLRNQMVAQEVENKMSLWLERKKAESYIKRVGK